MALAYLAAVLWTTGHPEESRARSDESLALAEELAEPMTLAQTWGMRALLHGARREFADMARWADRTHAFAADRGIPYWLHLSALLRHSASARTEGLGEGIERVSQSLDDYTATGARLGLPDFLLVLASLHLAAGDPGEAMKVIERAEQHIAATGERYSHSAGPAGQGGRPRGARSRRSRAAGAVLPGGDRRGACPGCSSARAAGRHLPDAAPARPRATSATPARRWRRAARRSRPVRSTTCVGPAPCSPTAEIDPEGGTNG